MYHCHKGCLYGGSYAYMGVGDIQKIPEPSA